MLKHFGGFVVGVFVGVLVIAVALVGGGYMLLTKEGAMKKVEETVGSSVGMDLNEEQENLSILDYGKGVLSIFGNLSTTPIKDIEATVGINKISTTISDAIGIDAETIGESSISNLGVTLSDNLTMSVMSNKFEIELPDLPLFQDEEFLAKPLSEAFGDLDQNTLDSFIEVVYDEDATEENPASSALIQKLGKKTIKEVSEDMDAIIQDTAIGEVMEIGEDSTSVLLYLKDTKIGELDGAIKEMTIGDAIVIDESSSKVLQYLKGSTLDGLDTAIKEMTIADAVVIDENSHAIMKSIAGFTLEDLGNKDKLQGAINDLKLEDVMEVGENSHAVINAIKDLSIGDLGNSTTLQDRINELKLGDVVAIDDSSAKLLQSLKDTKIGGLSTAMDDLTLEQVMDKHNVGVLSLVPSTTKVQDVGTALSDAVTNTSIYALRQAGVFSYDLDTSYTELSVVQRIYTNNSTPQEIISDVTGNKTGKDREAIAPTVFLSVGSTANNTTFYTTAMAHAGYKGAIDLSSVSEIKKTTSGAYILTPTILDAIFTKAGISNRHDVIFCVDDGIKLSVETDALSDNFTKVFSIMYASGQGDITFGEGLKMDTAVGGCAVYVASSITVYDVETDSYVKYDSSKELPIELRKVSREEVEENGTIVVKESANTWLSAYNEYQSIVTQ